VKDVSLDEIVAYLDQTLDTAGVPDYPNAVNGLQLSNRGRVRKVAAAVDFSTTTVNHAIAEHADLLLVHHGMFWSGIQPIVGRAYSRIRDLVEAGVAVYSSHLPLDRHPTFGNNALLAKTLGLETSGDFAQFKNISIGVQGTADIPTSTLVDRARSFSQSNGGDVITSAVTSNHVTKRWAVCSGSGASAETLAEASRDGIDTLIVGEGPHWTAIDAEERNIAIIYMGHYATETLGVFALADELNRNFGIASVKISAPTGL
jgi:dinuclear metal center YbgI/SA1388 family protein